MEAVSAGRHKGGDTKIPEVNKLAKIMAEEKMDDDLKKIIIETSTDMKWMKKSLEEVKDQLKIQCRDIKILKKEVSQTSSRVRDEVIKFLDDELEKRDHRINGIETELGSIKLKMYAMAGIIGGALGTAGSKLREILGI